MSFYQELKDYFDLHKRERRGVTVLVLVLSGVVVLMAAMPYVVHPKIQNREQIAEKVEEIRALQRQREEAEAKAVKDKKTKKQAAKELFSFNPNATSDEDWKKLGLSSKQIKILNNYLSKGGKFYKPSDLAKIYSISEEQYLELQPYITIPKETKKQYSTSRKKQTEWKDFSDKSWEDKKWSKEKTTEKKAYIKKFIDINSADTTELKTLKGIGSFYARKIVEHRTELGGYISKDQLLEIWKFSPESLESISEEIHLGKEVVTKIRLNHCTLEELANHPYVSWKQAKALIAYRDQHGQFNDIQEITNSHLITKELCQKVTPYLTLD